ncbi:MAG TPA: efflux RND transporter periplasmic adaptor subunit [Bacteroidia bacterium]|nr:efflux RND transporter periplasmic adaptor subunit [Bacteroidia bacterium]
MKKKKGLAWYYWVLIIVALLIIAMLAFGGKESKTRVSVEKASRSDIIETVTANGKIQPEVEVKISPEVSGEIVDLFVKEGDSVKRGQLLFRINPDLLQSDQARNMANLNNAKANLTNAEARLAQLQARFKSEIEPGFERNRKLHKDKVISEAEWQIAQATYQSSQKEIEAAKATVDAARYSVNAAEAVANRSGKDLLRTEIYATMDGIISELFFKKGERVVGTAMMAGSEVLRIADMSRMELKVDVSENDIIRVALGDTAIVEVDAYPGKKFKGVVKEVASSATASLTTVSTDQVTNFEVRISILPESYSELMKGSNNVSPFRPGMSGTADIQTDMQPKTLSVPIEAVTTRTGKEGKAGDRRKKDEEEKDEASNDNAPERDTDSTDEKKEVVFKLVDGKAVMVRVKTGIQDNKNIQILEGVKEGDQIITGPYSAVSKTLKEGDEVEVVDKDDLFGKK